MRRMLDPKEAGGSLPSTIKFDTEGNRTVGKNLGVDGKLTSKSLVSESNPDGDITKELGGGGGGGGGSGSARHCYFVDVDGQFVYIVYTEKNYNFTIGKQNTVADFMSNPDYAELHAGGESFNDKRCYPAIGMYTGHDDVRRIVRELQLINNHKGYVNGTALDSSITTGSVSIDLSNISRFFSIVQLY